MPLLKSPIILGHISPTTSPQRFIPRLVLDSTTANAACVRVREQVLADTGGTGVDAFVDCIETPTLNGGLRSLRQPGRVVVVGNIDTRHFELNLGYLLVRSISVIGSDNVARAALRQVRVLVQAGKLRPQIHVCMPLAQAAEAHRLFEACGATGDYSRIRLDEHYAAGLPCGGRIVQPMLTFDIGFALRLKDWCRLHAIAQRQCVRHCTADHYPHNNGNSKRLTGGHGDAKKPSHKDSTKASKMQKKNVGRADRQHDVEQGRKKDRIPSIVFWVIQCHILLLNCVHFFNGKESGA